MKLRNKILALNIATLAILLVVIGTMITLVTDNYNLSNTLKYLQGQSSYASIYIEQYAIGKSNNVFDIGTSMKTYSPYISAVLKDTVRSRVQIFYGSTQLGDSDENWGKTTEISPEIAVTFNGKSAYYIRTTPGGRVFYYAFPVTISNRYTYSIVFIYPLTEADNTKQNVIRMFLLTALFLVIITIASSSVITSNLTEPIETLRKASRRFSGGELGVRATVRSSDELGELSASFNQMAENIEDMIHKLNYEKEKQKHFFDNFTHEIRTPLTAIIGYSDLLWKAENSELRDKSIFYINSEARRMVKMTERLLELSKLNNYDYLLQKKETQLDEIIEEACDTISYKAKKNNIKFHLELESFSAFVDPELIRQVILNLLDNSIKYSGTKFIHIDLKQQKDHMILRIRDEGKGISDEDKVRIFDPYYKGDKSRNSGTEGWGLGLSIVKEIIEKHGGKIIIESKLNVGTETIIDLPLGSNGGKHEKSEKS